MEAFSEYGFFGALLAVGIVLGIVSVLVPLLISPRSKGEKTAETYECGMDTIGSAWIRFDVAFCLFALIFLAFSVKVFYLLPVAMVYDDGSHAWRDLVTVALFILILTLALLYSWRKGVFAAGATMGVVETNPLPGEKDHG